MPIDAVFIFPGQGSQAPGMLDKLARKHPEVRETFREASDALSKDLYALMQKGPEEELNRTVNTQPVMLAACVSVWRIWCNSTDYVPMFMAGHSFGEYSALVCAGSIGFADAVKIAARRGELMQNAVPEGKGAMAAVIGLESDRVVKLCREHNGAGKVVEPVNFNALTQVVVAGHAPAVRKVLKAAEAEGARRCVMLPVSVPAHSSLMKEAAEELAALLAEIKIKPPKVKVVHNVDALPHKTPEEILQALSEQLYNPVRWVDTVRCIANSGIEHFIELGPGKVLSSLVMRIDKSFRVLSVGNPDSLERAIGMLDA